jgi:uncharacterized protein YxjI
MDTNNILDANFHKVNDINFPLSLKFNVATFANDFVAKDANGTTISYVKQKMFKLIEDVSVFTDESQTTMLYQIKANKWIDFSATYVFTNSMGTDIGRVARKGWASIWKSRYEIYDEKQQQDLNIVEENGWIKVLDALFAQIPLVGIFTGYVFNPSYIVSRPDGTQVARLKKKASFFGRHFTVDKLAEFEIGEEERIVLSLMMMILLERRKG